MCVANVDAISLPAKQEIRKKELVKSEIEDEHKFSDFELFSPKLITMTRL